MHKSIEKIKIRELPDELIERIQKDIEPYEVILLDPNITGEQITDLSSGTLIQIDDKYCILTAKHVTNKLKKLKQIGLNLVTSVHNDKIETSSMQIVEINDPNENTVDEGLSVIILPETKSGTISAKRFWNLIDYRSSLLSKPIEWDKGLFFLCGTIGERAKIENYSGEFSIILNCECEFMYSGVKQYYSKKEFDYLKLSVVRGKRNDLPNSFRGASGGGIWRTELYRTNNGIIDYSSPLLVGMAYKQDAKTDGMRTIGTGITGYGCYSIYQQVIDKVR